MFVMAVHQVEEFYIHISNENLTDKSKVEEAKYLVEGLGLDFLLEDDSDLTIETLESESEANQLEVEVLGILNRK